MAPEAALQFLLQPGLKELLTSSYLFVQRRHLDIITDCLFLEGFFFPVRRVWCVRIQALTPRTEPGQGVPTHSVIYRGFSTPALLAGTGRPFQSRHMPGLCDCSARIRLDEI